MIFVAALLYARLLSAARRVASYRPAPAKGFSA
jgi:hypothetical protein